MTSASTSSLVNPVQELITDTPGILPTLCYMTQKAWGGLTKPANALFRVVRHSKALLEVVMAKPGLKCHPNLRQLLLTSYNWHVLDERNSSFYLQSNCEIEVGSMTYGHQLTRSVLSKIFIPGSDHIQDNKPQQGPG